MQCLVVDDSKSARFTLKRALTSLGHKVISAENGEHALEVLCCEAPDVIFMDHLMPGLDGFETSKKIRSQINFAKTPIIMCTAKDSESYAMEAKRIGLSGTLPKPATEQQIQDLLDVIFASEADQQTNSDSTPLVTPQPPDAAPAPAKVSTAAPVRNEIELNDQLRSLIRAEAEGRARDSAQRLLSDSWGRFRGNLQEDVRQQTRELFDSHIERSMDRITSEVQHTISASLSSELRQHLDKRLSSSETQIQVTKNELTQKINSLTRQLDLQKFDPITLQDTILEDAKRAAEYTATHKAVDTATKIARELCEDTISEILDTSILENFERQLVDMNAEIEAQVVKSRTLTVVASFSSLLAIFSFAVAVWALV